MSALELLGPLISLTAGYKECQYKQVRIWVDNQASVCIWKKGYSTSCPLSSTIVKAMAVIAGGLGCRIDVEKITRCSNDGSEMADSLSKGAFMRFHAQAKQAGWDIPLEMAWVPTALKAWISNPLPDDFLGQRILSELSLYTPV